MLVSGYAGIGKSALVQEVYQPLLPIDGVILSPVSSISFNATFPTRPCSKPFGR